MWRWSSVVGQRQVHRMTRQLTLSSLDLGRTMPAQAFCSARPSQGQMHVVASTVWPILAWQPHSDEQLKSLSLESVLNLVEV